MYYSHNISQLNDKIYTLFLKQFINPLKISKKSPLSVKHDLEKHPYLENLNKKRITGRKLPVIR